MSKREYLCAYGNCERTDISVAVTRFGANKRIVDQQRFCSEEHAAAWLTKIAERTRPK